ncbi:hypothetical protein CsatB_022469 [Cannabis sativa]
MLRGSGLGKHCSPPSLYFYACLILLSNLFTETSFYKISSLPACGRPLQYPVSNCDLGHIFLL